MTHKNQDISCGIHDLQLELEPSGCVLVVEGLRYNFGGHSDKVAAAVAAEAIRHAIRCYRDRRDGWDEEHCDGCGSVPSLCVCDET
jgi:hypothetical protein